MPDVKNEFDTKYVPKAYLKVEAKDSFAEAPKRGEDGEILKWSPFKAIRISSLMRWSSPSDVNKMWSVTIMIFQ